MAKFVEVKMTSGHTVAVNPEMVSFVAPQGPLVNQSVVTVLPGIQLTLEGTPAELSAKFEGKPILGV